MAWSAICPKEYHVERDVSVLLSLAPKSLGKTRMSSLHETAKSKTWCTP
jgi:hypothetical protein